MQDRTKTKYGYITQCIFPNLLWGKIKDMDDKEQFKYAFIPSFIKSMIDKDNRFKNVNIGRKVWQNRIGDNYRAYINRLIEWDIIKIQLYKDGIEYYSFKNKGVCKCYSLTTSAIKSGYYKKDFKKNKPSVLTDSDNVVFNKIDIIDPVISYTHTSVKNLKTIKTIPTPAICAGKMLDEIESDFITSEITDKHWLEKLEYNNYSIHYGANCGRLYHPVISMSKNARKTVFYKNSDTVYDYDIKTCFPVLLLKFVPELEKVAYKQLLNGDIYTAIIDNTRYSRDNCKKSFQMFINGFVKNYVYAWFEASLPLTFEYIKANHKTMAKDLQTIESNIMVQGLIRFCMENNIENIITCHDGWIAPNDSDSFKIIGYVQSSFEKECGYAPFITNNIRHKPSPTICDGKSDMYDFMINRLQGYVETVSNKRKASGKGILMNGKYNKNKHDRWKELKTKEDGLLKKIQDIEALKRN